MLQAWGMILCAAKVGRWRWGECGFRGGNSLTLRFLAQVVKRSLLAS